MSTTDQEVDQQRMICKEYLLRNNVTNYIEFVDEGVSGATDPLKRPQMSKAIDALNAGDTLLFLCRDRMGRDIMHNILLSHMVRKKGAKLAYATQSFEGASPLEQKLMENVQDAFAEYELGKIKQRTKDKLRQLKEDGYCMGKIPFGYMRGERVEYFSHTRNERKCRYKIEINPEEMAIVHEMISMNQYQIGVGLIARMLNARAIYNRGKKWNHMSVYRVIKNYQNHMDSYLDYQRRCKLQSGAEHEITSQPLSETLGHHLDIECHSGSPCTV